MYIWVRHKPLATNTNKSSKDNQHTIWPCLALFFISKISFFSCDCKTCLSRSISLIDLSSILLFSLKISEYYNHIQWYQHRVYQLINIKTILSCRPKAVHPEGYVNAWAKLITIIPRVPILHKMENMPHRIAR